jgi:hypothetical protein
VDGIFVDFVAVGAGVIDDDGVGAVDSAIGCQSHQGILLHLEAGTAIKVNGIGCLVVLIRFGCG